MLAESQGAEELVQLVYPELRQVARYLLNSERAGHTLQPTALLNEGLLRLLNCPSTQNLSRETLLAFAATQMRRVLVDYSRMHNSKKRGHEFRRVPLFDAPIDPATHPDDILALNECLERLGAVDPRALTVVELKFFAGCTTQETAAVLHLTPAAVDSIWQHARLWLFRAMTRPAKP